MGDRGNNRHGPQNKGVSVHFVQELVPRLKQCGLGRGLLPYQVASSSIQQFGHNGHEPKTGFGAVPFFLRELGPHRSQSPWAKPYLHTKWHLSPSSRLPQQTLAENWGLCPFRGGELGPHLTQRRLGPTAVPGCILIHTAVWPQ